MTYNKTIGKKQLSQMLQISPATLSRWLNKRYFSELRQLGYTKTQKLLTPKIMNYLAEKLGMSPEE